MIVAGGIVANLARPGGNTTGLFLNVDADFIGKGTALRSRPAAHIPTRIWRATDRLHLRYVEVSDLRDIDWAFAELSKGRSGVIVPPPLFFSTHRTARQILPSNRPPRWSW